MAQGLNSSSINQSPGAQSPLTQSLKAAPVAKRMMMALMGGAGLILLGGGGALVGLNSHLASLQTVAQEKQKEVDGSEGIAKRYVVTQAAYTDVQSRIQCLEASVSPKSYVPTLLGQLQGLAAATHLSVTAVRPTPPPPAPPIVARPATGGDAAPGGDVKKAPPPPPYDTLDIAVDVTGTYADTAAFLYRLTRFPKILSVTSVQMHPGGQPDKDHPQAAPTVTTNLKLTAFMFQEEGADAPAAPSAALASTGQTVGSPVTAPPVAAIPATMPPAAPPSTTIPPASVGTISGAAGRAAAGAVGATKAANARGDVGVGTL